MVKVKDTNICESCYYWSGWTEGCSYLVEEKHSRLRGEDGKRYDPAYCDKYKKGRKKIYESGKQAMLGNYKVGGKIKHK